MGACLSSSHFDATPAEVNQNKAIDAELKEAQRREASILRVLLLGAGFSGKSTVVKQMRIIHNAVWSPSEIESFRQLCFDNIVNGVRTVIDAMFEASLKLEEHNMDNYVAISSQRYNIRDGSPFPRELLEPLQALWADSNLRALYDRPGGAPFPENLVYYYKDLSRFFEPSFKPSDQDIIQCHARTTGMYETHFKLNSGHELHLIDVGGQKSERRKWINFFENVTSLLFLVSLSGYDQWLFEDNNANQMQDALAVWEQVVNSKWFAKTSLILFLNKTDLFKHKLPYSDIRKHFPDYDGPANDPVAGSTYFRQRFVKLSNKMALPGKSQREVYTHLTCATDTQLLRAVMAAVEGIIALRSNLAAAAFL